MNTLVREHFDFSGGTVEETDAGPVIRGVTICGFNSVHGYDYLPAEVWGNGRAKEIYEGVPSYADHDKRSVTTKLGWWSNVGVKEDGRPKGDYHLCPEHPMCKSVVWAAKYNPGFFAVSHQAHVKWGTRNGRKVVEGITGRAISVDLVDKGGTLGGLFESAHGKASAHGRVTVATVKEYADKLGRKCSVEQLLKLKTLVREDEYGAATMMPDAPVADAEETAADDGIDSAFLSVCMKEIRECMDEAGDPVKLKKCLGRLRKILMAHGELTSEDVDAVKGDEADDGGPAETDGAAAPEKKVDESAKPKVPAKKPVQEVAPTPKTPDLATILAECDEQKFVPTALVREALLGIPDKTKRSAFIRERKGAEKATQPRSADRESLARESGHEQTPADGVEEARKRAAKWAAESQCVKATK